ncbi:thiamine phosphate synthase [Rufibacter sp. H-1]|uniref:Thiamine phosphate synthase n=1 Tax=Rufibacter sediminis TaxID=2762756 RepID=A0ABR6VPX7_9BACT|nr:thiamine phosphate synthase [Rufibacter sediminis]MBC3539215.1 thiamine phosphate synthase [Rufibacter sediminis]
MTQTRKIASGIYLVVDPAMEEKALLRKLEVVLEEELAAVQLWDNFYAGQKVYGLIQKIVHLCHAKEVPVLINNQWEFLLDTALDGVHFDAIPDDFAAIKKAVHRPFLTGLTCGNDEALIIWAHEKQLDYISFCSVFPSATSTSCELVTFESITRAKKISSMPVFLAGGIKPDNLPLLAGLEYDGVAVISGIMNADNPSASVKEYLRRLPKNNP